MNGFDVIIVGSGPAGVSSAWPLVQSGKKVLMLDWGRKPPACRPSTVAYRPDATEEEKEQTPKLSAPNLGYVYEGFREKNQIVDQDFAAHGSLARGGLSNVWSALAPVFTEEELVKFPVSREELLPFYQQTAQRIGISGSRNGDLSEWLGSEHLTLQPNLPLHPISQFLLSRYEKARSKIHSIGFRLGRHHQAILTQSLNGRQPFVARRTNHFTCQDEAVYNSACEIPQLQKNPNFLFQDGWFVDAIQPTGEGMQVLARDRSGGPQTFSAKKVLLAAGTIGSTRILLKSLKKYQQALPLLTTVVNAFALLLPRWLWRSPAQFGFSFWNLSYFLTLPEIQPLKIYGHLMPTDGVPITELVRRMPLSLDLNLKLARRLWPAMVLGTCVFPSDFSANQISLTEEGSLVIRGGVTDVYRESAEQAKQQLSRAFRKMGAILLKKSWSYAKPGSDLHYAGTLPMSKTPKPFHTNPDGESYDLKGVYLVDGSVFPYLPAKSHTLTLMSNALRIGQKLTYL